LQLAEHDLDLVEPGGIDGQPVAKKDYIFTEYGKR
jgi:hypothetical protein